MSAGEISQTSLVPKTLIRGLSAYLYSSPVLRARRVRFSWMNRSAAILNSGISFGFVIRLIPSSRSHLRFRSASSANLFELVFVLSRIREPAKANSYQ